MKILQLIQKKQLRGAEVFAAQLATHLVNQGHDVLIVALVDGDVHLPFDGNIISVDASLKKKFLDIGSWKKLASIIAEFKPDVIQANAGDTLKYAVFSKIFFRWKQPIIFRNASMLSHYARGRFSKLFIKFLFGFTKQVISVSNTTKKDLIENLLMSSSKIKVIPVGVEMKSIVPVSFFDNQHKNIIHVGGFSFEKNHKGLLNIFKKIIAADDNYRLWLLGEGPLKNQIVQQVDEMGLNDKVNFLGFVNNPMDYIASADLLVLPSIIEGLPGVIIEAFYCKTPVVAYHVGGIADLITDHQTERIIKVNDEAAFADAVIEMLNNTDTDRYRIINAAYEKSVTEFSNKEIAIRFADIYSNLTANNKSA